MSRFNRTNFFPTEVVQGINERDIAQNYFNDFFEIRRPMSFYAIESADIARPDNMSIKFYGRMDYWWIVCRVNKIDDVWNDMKPGDIIQVPDVQDINNYFMSVRSHLAKG